MTTTVPDSKEETAKIPYGIDVPANVKYYRFQDAWDIYVPTSGIVTTVAFTLSGLFAIACTLLQTSFMTGLIGSGIIFGALILVVMPIAIAKVRKHDKATNKALTEFINSLIAFSKERYGANMTFREAENLVGHRGNVDVTTDNGERIAVRFSTNSDRKDGRLVQITNARELPLI